MATAIFFLLCCIAAAVQGLRFDATTGLFKILQVADMHFANGKTTRCLNVLPHQMPSCSDLNTTAFLRRLILAEKPDLIIFTGDNIYGFDATDAAASLNAAFAPAVSSNIPWVAILGNHDQESATLSREGVMKHIVGMKNTLSLLNPSQPPNIDGFGNYNLEVHGVADSANKSLLNLYFLDSGDYSKEPSISGYDWIKPSQQQWFNNTSFNLKVFRTKHLRTNYNGFNLINKPSELQKSYENKPNPLKGPAPGLVYFHIPLPEYANIDVSKVPGVKGDPVSSPTFNSGFFDTMVKAGDVKGVFVGHDHLNDFCGDVTGIKLCYAGGFGYHAYGKAGWSRRARVVVASLNKTGETSSWGDVGSIETWKRLDDENLSRIDHEVVWSTPSRMSSRSIRVDGSTLNISVALIIVELIITWFAG